MASARRPRSHPLKPKTGIQEIITEAQKRWLKPVEVCEIINQYQTHGFKLNPIAPVRPASGSLFLFDRNVLRYFRKDGHNWRKKRDLRTVREAHERLKIGNVDVLHCYYAHGETNPNFQRRCYWMLDPSMEHIVLVHYREVDELGRIIVSPSHGPSPREERSRSSSMSVGHEHNGGSAGESEEASAFSTAEAFSSVLNKQAAQLDQVSPQHQKPGALEVGPRGNGLDPLSMPKSSETVHPDLAGIESMLNSPSVFAPGASPSSFSLLSPLGSDHFNRQQQQHEHLVPVQGSSIESMNSAKLGSRFTGVGPQPSTKDEELDMVGWKELLASTQSNQTIPSNDTGVPGGSATAGEPVTTENTDDLNWADMLEQCMTPESHLAMLDSVQSQDDPVVQSANDLSQTQALSYLKQILSPTVPPTVQHQEPLTKDDALQLYQKRFPMTRMDLQQTDAQLDSQTMELGDSKFEHVQNPGPERSLTEAVGNKNMDKSLTKFDGLNNLKFESSIEQSGVNDSVLNNFRKLDSFGRWMSTHLSSNNENFLLDPGSPHTPVLEDHGVSEAGNRKSVEMQTETGLHTPVIREQSYSIIDFSPNFGYSFEETKVLVTGMFLGEYNSRVSDIRWCCMFGEVEVPAEVLGGGALRCKAPAQATGRVSFYITCGDRQPHSEIREFEYCSALRGYSKPDHFERSHRIENEMLLKIRLTCMLLEVADAPKSDNEGDLQKQSSHGDCFDIGYSRDEWLDLEHLAMSPGNSQALDFHEQLLQMLLKCHMQKWLLCRGEDEVKGPAVLNREGQGVLHMTAALGYHWAIAPLVTAGLPINFRDIHGWTALHWAAWYGQEEAILHLLKAGADPAAVTDPTVTITTGQTAADLAASNGYVGISGFLAESSLTSRLSAMTFFEDPEDIKLSHIAGHNAVAKLDQESLKRSVVGDEDQLSLEASIDAVQNAAKSKALIQAAFRQHSFRKREKDALLASMPSAEYNLTADELQAWMTANAAKKIQKAYRGHHGRQQSAATHIQHKYRGWKVRREFLRFRQQVVMLQAHVRGHIVRKRFTKLLWSVSVVEKAVLRWLRRRHGLRGFRNEFILPDRDDDEFLREGRKKTEVALDKDVTRVVGMVPSRKGRAQYRRLREKSLQSHQTGSSELDVCQPTQSSEPEVQQQMQSSQARSPEDILEIDDPFTSFTASEYQGQSFQLPPLHDFLDSTDDTLMTFTD
jgi:hypothetical protein